MLTRHQDSRLSLVLQASRTDWLTYRNWSEDEVAVPEEEPRPSLSRSDSYIGIGSFVIRWHISGRVGGAVGLAVGAVLTQLLNSTLASGAVHQGSVGSAGGFQQQCQQASPKNLGTIPTILPSPRGVAPVEKIAPAKPASQPRTSPHTQTAVSSAPSVASARSAVTTSMSATFDLADGSYIDVQGGGFPPNRDLHVTVGGVQVGTLHAASDGTLNGAVLVQQSLLAVLVGGATYTVAVDLDGSTLASARATAPGAVGQVLGGLLGGPSGSATP